MRAKYSPPTMTEVERHPINCNCCGTAKMAERVGDNIVIKDRQHGKVHVVVIPLSERAAT